MAAILKTCKLTPCLEKKTSGYFFSGIHYDLLYQPFIVRWQGTISVHCSPYKVFCCFYITEVYSLRISLASLGNPRNMQINTAITVNLVFINISVIIHGIKIILVSIPIFCEVKNQIKPF